MLRPEPSRPERADRRAGVPRRRRSTETDFDHAAGASDYLVHVVVPDDQYGKPLYNFTTEEDINIGNGDEFYPSVPPPACVGALHTVDVADMDAQGNYRFDADGNPNPAFDPRATTTRRSPRAA